MSKIQASLLVDLLCQYNHLVILLQPPADIPRRIEQHLATVPGEKQAQRDLHPLMSGIEQVGELAIGAE